MPNNILRYCMVTCLGILITSSAAYINQNQSPAGSVSAIVGNAMVKRQLAEKWLKAKIRLPVFENDSVSTEEESRCELSLTGDKIIRLGENSTAVIAAFQKNVTKIKAAQGSVWINVKHLVNNRSFEIASPTAVAAIRGTVFSINCDTNTTQFSVFRGAVAVTTQKNSNAFKDSTFLVTTGRQITLVKDLNMYLKDQEKTFRNFMQQSQAELDTFERQDLEAFEKYKQDMQEQINKMISDERNAFKTFGTTYYALRKIDTVKNAKNDWVQWNLARDKLLGW